MARGSLAGIVSGVVVSGLALGVASLSLPPVEMGAPSPGAGADGPAMVETEGAAPPQAQAEAAPETSPDTMPETQMETAPETAPDAGPAAQPAAPESDAAQPEEAPQAEEGAELDEAVEPGDSADAPGGAADSAPAPAPEDDTAAAPDAAPAAEPLTGDETGADPASAPAQGAEETPKRGEAAEAEIAAQPTGTPLPETDRSPQMESDAKAPMVEAEEPAAIPGMELVEKLPPALSPAPSPANADTPEDTPEITPEDTPAASAPEAAREVAPDTGEPADKGAATVAAPDTGAAADTGAAPDTGDGPDTSLDKAPGSALVIAPEPVAEPEAAIAPEPVAEPETAMAPDPEPAPAPEPEPAPEIATIVAEPAPQPAPETPRIAAAPPPEPAPAPEPGLAPAPGLSGADRVVTGRLPTIGGAPAEEAPEAEADAPELDPAVLAGLPAIERNRIEFTAEGDQPLLALLLLDNGDRTALEDIGKLPFPLTVAVDAGAADAAEAIDFYAKRGIEVALLLPLPDGATPADVDVTVQAYTPLLDSAAEVLVDSALGFQALGPGAVQLATNLAESGHGLVSFPSGLNTGHKAALKQNVPAGLVFLDLDGDGQGAPVIRRFLDNAAFRARNEAGVIVLAHTRAETLQALLDWSLGNRAQTVTLAPISAVLLAE